jgi:hypothetical protein
VVVSETETTEQLTSDHYALGGGGSGASISDAGIREDHAGTWVDTAAAVPEGKLMMTTATPHPAVSGQSGERGDEGSVGGESDCCWVLPLSQFIAGEAGRAANSQRPVSVRTWPSSARQKRIDATASERMNRTRPRAMRKY